MLSLCVKRRVAPPLGLRVALRGWTPLHFAALKGHGSMVELLLNHKVDVGVSNNSGPGPWSAGGSGRKPGR